MICCQVFRIILPWRDPICRFRGDNIVWLQYKGLNVIFLYRSTWNTVYAFRTAERRLAVYRRGHKAWTAVYRCEKKQSYGDPARCGDDVGFISERK